MTRRAARMVLDASAVVLGPTLLVWGALLIVAPEVSEGAAPGARLPVGWKLDLPPVPADVPSWNDTVPGSNTIIDLIYRMPDDLWVATARGVSHLTFPGDTWLTYGTEDGLGGAEIPAMGVFGSGVWAATSHLQKLASSSVARGDGIYWLNEGSGQWEDRSPTYELVDGGTVRQASGAAMLCYDMAEFRDGLVAACWAGGLVLSPDAGETWRNVFLDSVARNDFEEQKFSDLGNLYFSVVVDESAPESLTVFAGSAWGIQKFVYLHDTLKLTGFDFRDLALDGERVYAATESGLSVTPNRGGSWVTFYESRGLSSNHIGTVAANGDTIWVGLESADGSDGEGVAYSHDDGATWIVPEPPAALGSNRVRDIIIASDGIWLASSAAGLFHYADGVWTTYLGDREVNAILTVERDGLSPLIHAGTDQGVVILTSEPGASWDTLAIGLPGDHISQRVVDLAFQPLPCDTINIGAEALWAVVRNSDSDADSTNGFATSIDGGTTWTVSSRRLPSSDVDFFGCRFYLASDSGLAEGSYPSVDEVAFTSSFRTAISGGRISSKVQAVHTVIGKDHAGLDSLTEIWVATDSGLARSLNAALSWGVAFSNPDPNEFDSRRTLINLGKDTAGDFIELSGNFVTALALQPNPYDPEHGKPILWAATRGTGRGRFENEILNRPSKNGISFSLDGGGKWFVPELDTLGTSFDVWNISSDNQQVWAASSQGLLGSTDRENWTVRHNFEDPWSGATIDTTVEILDAETIGDELWVGTENGMVVLDLTGGGVQDVDAGEATSGRIRRGFKPVDPDDRGSGGGAYATPVPYSPTYARSRGGLRLHYVPPVSGKVTITLYDFANNVVAVLMRGEDCEAGKQYDESVVWDGRNGDGDIVAVGTYFFVIEYENGDVHWGKIAIIP